MKQKLWVTAAILLPLACLAVCVWKFEQAVAQPRLDHTLIAAIQNDDAPQTLRLLRDGANPNANDAPPPPSFWQWLIQRWRGETLPSHASKNAMQIALARAVPDINEESPPYESRLRIVAALHERGASDTSGTGDTAGYDSLMPAFQGQDWTRNGAWDNAQMAEINTCRIGYAAFLRNHGLSLSVIKNLALAHYWLGDLNGAAFLCRVGQCWVPSSNSSESASFDYISFDFMLAKVNQQAIDLPRNAELITAVQRDDAAGVSAALERGADPNARDIPAWPEIRAKLLQSASPLTVNIPARAIGDLSPELQDKAPAVAKREAPSTRPYPTALKIAVYRDMTPFAGEYDSNDDPQAPEQSRFDIIKALHDAGATPAADLTEREKSLPKPTASENNAANFPRGGNIRFPHNWNAWAEAKFLIVNGMSARAYAELAEYCARFSADEWAVHAYHVALLWNPNDAALANAAQQIEDLPRACRAIQRIMPTHWTLERACPYPSEGAMKRWAVLYDQDKPDKEVGYHCAVYSESRAGFTLLFRGEERIVGSGIDLEYALYVLPLTGRRLPEIIGLAQGSMAGAEPAQIVAYALEGNGWKRVLKVDSNQGIWLEKRRGRRAYVVRNGYETGVIMCHADQPRRSDVYAWSGKEYVFADVQFPELFREYIKDAEEVLRVYPNDWDLPYHLACMYTFTRQKRKAERYWRRAECAVRSNINHPDDYSSESSLKDTLKDILARRLVPTNGY